jgi:hypothetical protein
MADAPSGGGSKWEPFEIILLILLAIGLLSRLQTKPAPTASTPKSATVSKAPTTPHEVCGLTTTRPHALEKVSSFVTLAGTVSGCNWVATESVALYAQVIDSRGMPVSAYTTVAPVAANGAIVSFNTTITLTTSPTKGTGYLILIPANDQSDHTINARIPITFSIN